MDKFQSTGRPSTGGSADTLAYNARIGLMICCPMTTQIKGYPFEVIVSGQPRSAAPADHVRSLDWRARRTKRKGRISDVELAELRGKLLALID